MRSLVFHFHGGCQDCSSPARLINSLIQCPCRSSSSVPCIHGQLVGFIGAVTSLALLGPCTSFPLCSAILHQRLLFGAHRIAAPMMIIFFCSNLTAAVPVLYTISLCPLCIVFMNILHTALFKPSRPLCLDLYRTKGELQPQFHTAHPWLLVGQSLPNNISPSFFSRGSI